MIDLYEFKNELKEATEQIEQLGSSLWPWKII